MTIAISVKVHDGVVLAADSAGSLVAQINNAPTVIQVYNNANKVFNLCKGLPIGAISWGTGAIGKASISTLLKDLRVRFSGRDAAHMDWHLDPASYTVEQVATQVYKFIFEELYTPEFVSWPQKPIMGMIIAGYSAGGTLADEFRFDIDSSGNCSGPVRVRPNGDCGASWSGEPEAISRLLLGYSSNLSALLATAMNVPVTEVASAISQVQNQLSAQIINDAMPIKDAVDVAEFLVEITCRFSRYTPGAATVGGPVEVAAITKHEGFKWVKRKFYFSQDLNPEPAV